MSECRVCGALCPPEAETGYEPPNICPACEELEAVDYDDEYEDSEDDDTERSRAASCKGDTQ